MFVVGALGYEGADLVLCKGGRGAEVRDKFSEGGKKLGRERKARGADFGEYFFLFEFSQLGRRAL